jgi:excisionase family DNA binding protein
MTGRATASSPADDLRPFKVSEGKELSGLGLNQFYAGVRTGEIPSIKVGRRILLPRKAFLAWLNGDRSDATK